MSQTSYSDDISISRKGLCNNLINATVHPFTAQTGTTFGLVVQRYSSDEDDQIVPMAALPAADAVGIASTTTISTAATTFSGTDFSTGTVGTGRISPPQRISLVLSSDADFDLTTAFVAGQDAAGNDVEAPIHVPDAGNTTVYTAIPMSRVRSVYLPAQSGAATFTIGTDSTISALDKNQFPGICIYDETVVPNSTTVEVLAGTVTRVMLRGQCWVVVEAAVTAGDDLYVRVTESGTDLRGQMRGTPASGFVRYPGGVFITDQSSADGLALVELS